MKRKIFSGLLALVLALSFSLVTAVPMAETVEAQSQQPNPTFVTVDVTADPPTIPSDDEITIGWSTARGQGGSAHSIHVEATAATMDYAMVGVPTDFVLDGATTISYWGYTMTGSDVLAPDEIFLFLDTDNNGEVDIILAATSALGTVDQWKEWTLATEVNWYTVDPANPVPVSANKADYLDKGYNVLGIALGAGSPTAGQHQVDVFFDNLVVNGETLLDDCTGTIEVLSKTIGGVTFTSSIQDAIDAALPGTTINVAAGTYTNETFPITVNTENLTLKGAQFGIDPTAEGARTVEADESTIDAAGATGNANAIEITADGVTVTGFTIKNAPRFGIKIGDSDQVLEISGVSVSNNIIKKNLHGVGLYYITDSNINENIISENSGAGVFISHATFTTIIENNVITGSGEHAGILLSSDPGLHTDPVIQHNTITNNPIGVFLYGVDIEPRVLYNEISGNTAAGIQTYITEGGTFTGNTIENNGGDGISIGAGQSGSGQVRIIEGNTITGNAANGIWAGPYNLNQIIKDNIISANAGHGIFVESQTVEITGNTITGNDNDGIFVDVRRVAGIPQGPDPDVTAHFNNIYDNTGYGVKNAYTAVIIDATLNWWGDISGPQHETMWGEITNPGGTGDKVSDNVSYIPWLTRQFETVLADNIAYFGVPMVWLDTGWNTLSTPIALDPAVDTWGEFVALGDGLDIHPTSPAWYFDGATQTWEQVLGNFRLKPVDAIYVRMAEPDIAAILFSPEPSVPSKPLYAGWNLVSLAYLPEYEWDVGMPPYEALETVYTVTGDLTGWSLVVSPPVNLLQWFFLREWGNNPNNYAMYITEGYWVFMINPGTLAGFSMTPIPLGLENEGS